jgi:hypothetical protein
VFTYSEGKTENVFPIPVPWETSCKRRAHTPTCTEAEKKERKEKVVLHLVDFATAQLLPSLRTLRK